MRQQVILLHDILIKQTGGGPRDESFPETTINAPFYTFADQDLCPTKVARRALGLVNNDPSLN